MIKDLRTRLGLGSILVAMLVGLFILDRDVVPGIGMVVLGLLALTAQAEFYAMLQASGRANHRNLGLLFGALTLANAWWHFLPLGYLLVGLLVALLVLEVIGRRPEGAPDRIGTTLLGWLVVPLLLSSLMALRQAEPDGWDWILFLVVVCKAGDSAAYLVGSAIGKRKLIPEVSPNKSWEGAWASMAGSLLGAAIVADTAFGGRLDLEVWLGAAVVTNIGAQFGDLTESLLKRGCETKDSSTVLPAFGGSFDMVDSFLIATPALHGFLLAVGYSS